MILDTPGGSSKTDNISEKKDAMEGLDNSVSILRHTEKSMNCNICWMVIFLLCNLVTGGLMLSTAISCRDQHLYCRDAHKGNKTEIDKCAACQSVKTPSMAFSSLTDRFESCPILSLTMYSIPFLMMFPLFTGINRQFRIAYEEVYLTLRCRLFSYFIIGQSVILARGFIFYRINYHENGDDFEAQLVRGYQYSVVIFEILNGGMIMYIAARNLQSSEEPE